MKVLKFWWHELINNKYSNNTNYFVKIFCKKYMNNYILVGWLNSNSDISQDEYIIFASLQDYQN